MQRSCIECEKEYGEKELVVCKNCNEGGGGGGVFCKKCYEITHKPRAFQSHSSIPFSSFSAPSILSSSTGALRLSSGGGGGIKERCKEHKIKEGEEGIGREGIGREGMGRGREIELYCEECEEVLCILCSKMIKHKNHSSTSIYLIGEYLQTFLFPSLETLQKNVNFLYHFVNEKIILLKEKREKLSAEIEKEQMKIDQFFDVFIDFLRLQKRIDRQSVCDINKPFFGSVEEIDRSIDRFCSFSTNLFSDLTLINSLLLFNDNKNDQDQNGDLDRDNNVNNRNNLKRSKSDQNTKNEPKNEISITKMIKTKKEIEKNEKEIKKMIGQSIDQLKIEKIEINDEEKIRSHFISPPIDLTAIKQMMIDLLPDHQKQNEIDQQINELQKRDQKWIDKMDQQKEEIDQLNKTIADQNETIENFHFQFIEQKKMIDQLIRKIEDLKFEIIKVKCSRCHGGSLFHTEPQPRFGYWRCCNAKQDINNPQSNGCKQCDHKVPAKP